MQAQGLALLDLTAVPDGALYTRSVVRFTPRRTGRPLSSHAFTRGDNVLVSTGEPTQDAIGGVVVDVAARWVRVSMPQAAAAAQLVAGACYRLDLAANVVAFERARDAIEAFAELPPSEDPSQPLRRCGASLSAHE